MLNLTNPVQAADISNLTAFDDGGTASYNAMLLATQWRATRDLTLNANYTWSHCIGIASVGSTTPNPGTNYVHLYDRNLDVGNCTSDRRNVFNFTAITRTPNFSNKALHLLGTGWSLSAIYRYSSGSPITIASGLDNSLLGFATTQERPNQILNNTASAYQGQACANVTPLRELAEIPRRSHNPPSQTATWENMGVANVLGPKFFQFDIAVVRDFRIRERETLAVPRGSIQRSMNNVRFNNPSVTLSSPSTFGNILSAQDPRILQLAMKFNF